MFYAEIQNIIPNYPHYPSCMEHSVKFLDGYFDLSVHIPIRYVVFTDVH